VDFRRQLTIRREIFLIGLLSLITISIVLTAIQSVTIFRLSMDSVYERIGNANRQIASDTESDLEELALTVTLMAANPDVIYAVSTGEDARRRALLLFKFIEDSNPNVFYCCSGYPNGELLINDYVPGEGFDPVVRPWYVAAVNNHPGLSIGLPYREFNTHEWLIAVSKTLEGEGGEITGVISVDSTLAGMSEVLNRVEVFESQTNFVVDSDGVVLVHQNLDYIGQRLASIAPDAPGLFADESGLVTYEDEGETLIARYTALDVTDWVLVSTIERAEVIRPIRIRILLTILGVLVVSILLGALQVLIYGRRFVRPLVALRKRVSDITSGLESQRAIEPFSNPELSSIAEQIEEMTETAQSKRASELKLILESTNDGILVLDDNNEVIHYNARFLELWGLGKESAIRGIDDDILGRIVECVEPDSADVTLRRDSDGDEITSDRIYLKSGMVLEQYSCPIVEDGRISGRLWSYSDITAKTVAEEQLKLLATTDDLTGLCNRRCFMDRAEYEIEQAGRHKRPLSLAQIDIDHFKNINDTHGHLAGDDALRFLATSLTALVRSTDTVARTGGDEFIILLPGTDGNVAYAVVEKARAFFAKNAITSGNASWNLSVSVGVACSRDVDAGVDQFLHQADRACHAAKRAGRNRSVLWSENLEQ
jgi:diguanylate cyclase (GGDEF)-like protein